MQLRSIILLFIFSTSLSAQEITLLSQNITINRFVDGTLLLPNEVENPPLAIIIAGSGPTDRNGNQNFMQNNSLKKLAEGLSKTGIATFRYDKRIVKQIRMREIDNNIMFDDFIADAVSVLNYFKEKYSFRSIYIIGHSQGSLVGMITAQEGVDGFISIAGAGKSIDEVIIDQVANTAPMLFEDTKRVFSILRERKTTDDYPPALSSIFKKENQPFISNWMFYKPQDELKILDVPILIVNGTKDIQVSIEEAKLLHSASPQSKLVLIEKMNHILVPIDGDTLENTKSYNESFRKIATQLIDEIAAFIN